MCNNEEWFKGTKYSEALPAREENPLAYALQFVLVLLLAMLNEP